MAREEDFEELGKTDDRPRSSARTKERFPIEFQRIEASEIQRLMPMYEQTRTSQRDDVPVGAVGGDGADIYIEGASQVQMQIFHHTMRAIHQLERKVDELLASGGTQKADSSKMSKAMCLDLSATGLRMVTPVRLEKGNAVKILITLPPLHPAVVGVLAKVVKVGEVRLPSGKTACDCAVNFEAINELDREEIVSYVFKRHREEAARAAGAEEGD